MLLENAVSRIFLGVHWIFDAYDFTVDVNGNLILDLSNENIGGVPLGLRIARDIYAFGLGKAPKMTPNGTASPPITTPPANSPMPAQPKQPASINGCIEGPTISTGEEPKVDSPEDPKGEIQEPFPAGVSEE
jgi:vanadium chloroperoxidase